jgi:Fe-S oxidoreductase
MAKWVGGIAPQRTIPRYAPRSFTQWFRARTQPQRGGRRVMLWPDTFNNYFRPQTAIAATRALEALGFEVAIPDRPLCCGRPLYDWGMVDKAKGLWQRTIAALAPEIANGTTLVGLEPACVSAFRDELVALFPGDERAARLSRQTLLLSEFVERDCPDAVPRGGGSALVHIHCHHHAVIKSDAERALLDRMGLRYDIPSTGCCGMAGSFGFEASKYDVSMTLAERALLPAVRAAPAETSIVADGFSCREQIEQGSGRATLHVAELLARQLAAAGR